MTPRERAGRKAYGALLKKYEYDLPQGRIAMRPAKPRDAARLLVYERKTGRAIFDRFANLGKYLPPGAVLVLNDTKVVPARLMTKSGREKVELFYVGRDRGVLRMMADRPLEKGSVLKTGRLSFKILGREERWYRVKPSFPATKIYVVLERYGCTPLPPYLGKSPLSEKRRREEYQTVFAQEKGSVAAPTASLHFTESLLTELKKRGIGIVRVTLHVNLGTFAPLNFEQVADNRLHEEKYEITPAAARELNAAKSDGRPIIVVGTTACRTLESAARRSIVKAGRGTTRLFIREPYRFRFVDALITNFHVPRSSLMMLVAAFVGRERLLALYDLAVKKKMRFLSFGDGMLIK
jgi:S-adenosylmethionine:tRNA ribosyltransferase-isomerase